MRTLKIQGSDRKIRINKVFCLGSNYSKHIDEMESKKPSEPVVFMKPATAVIKDGDDIVIPSFSRNPQHEVELVVVIGKKGKNITVKRAYDHVLGYAVGMDITLRDIQQKAKEQGRPWTVAKGFDTSAPVSVVIKKENIENPHDLTLNLYVNDELRQSGNTKDMIFRIDEVISYISKIFTIERGDLIFTGTPEGVGRIKNGDIIKAEIFDLVSVGCRVKLNSVEIQL